MPQLDTMPRPDETVVKNLNEAYLQMRAAAGPKPSGPGVSVAGATLLRSMDALTHMDPGTVFATLNALVPGALRFVAAQAIEELGQLEWAPDPDLVPK